MAECGPPLQCQRRSASVRKPGPVHINIAFREPTVPVTNDGRTVSGDYPFPIEGKASGDCWLAKTDLEMPALEIPFEYHAHGVVIAGEGIYDRERLSSMADELGWPILATAQSGMRGTRVASSYHHLLVGGVPRSLRPEVVFAIGAVGPSQRVEELVAAARVRIKVDRWGRHIDPGRECDSYPQGGSRRRSRGSEGAGDPRPSLGRQLAGGRPCSAISDVPSD